MIAQEYLKENGCKNCSSKDVKITTVNYTNPLSYNYVCNDCDHSGNIHQINYQFPVVNLDITKYFQAKQFATDWKISIDEAVKAFGGTIDEGPEPEYEIN